MIVSSIIIDTVDFSDWLVTSDLVLRPGSVERMGLCLLQNFDLVINKVLRT
jgi:hypothetical protein